MPVQPTNEFIPFKQEALFPDRKIGYLEIKATEVTNIIFQYYKPEIEKARKCAEGHCQKLSKKVEMSELDEMLFELLQRGIPDADLQTISGIYGYSFSKSEVPITDDATGEGDPPKVSVSLVMWEPLP